MAEQRSEEVRDEKHLLSGGNIGVTDEGVKELGSSTGTGDEENEKDLKVSDDDMAPKCVPHQPMPRDKRKRKYVKEDAKFKRKHKNDEDELSGACLSGKYLARCSPEAKMRLSQAQAQERRGGTLRNDYFAMTSFNTQGQDEIVGGGEDGDSGGGGSTTQQVSAEAKTTRSLSLKSNSNPPKKSTGQKLKKIGRWWK